MVKDNSEVRAVIRALEGDVALVEVQGGGCGRCHEEGGCGGHHLTQALCSAPKTYRVANPAGLKVGDEVTLGIASRAVWIGASFAYALPVLVLLAGAMIGAFIHDNGGAILGGVIGLFTAWLILRWKVRHGLENSDFQPQIVTPDSIQHEMRR